MAFKGVPFISVLIARCIARLVFIENAHAAKRRFERTRIQVVKGHELRQRRGVRIDARQSVPPGLAHKKEGFADATAAEWSRTHQ
jgi:hypothetical protein